MQHNEQRGSLSEKFRDFGAAPTPESWTAIEERLEKRQKRRIPIWWWSGAGAASVALCVFLFLPENNRHVAVSPEKHTEGIAKNSALDIARDTTSQPAFNMFIPVLNFGPFLNWQFYLPDSYICHYPDSYINFIGGYQLRLSEGSPKVDSTAETQSQSLPKDSSLKLTSVEPESRQTPKSRNRKWLIALNYGTDYRTGANMPPSVATSDQLDGMGLIPGQIVAPSSTNTFLHQRSMELTVGRTLWNRFTVVSGIHAGVYSTGKVEGNSSLVYGTTTARTIGIPLSLEYDVLRNNRFSVSPGIGLMHQWISHIKSSTTTKDNNSAITTSATEATRFQSTVFRGYVALRLRVFRNAWLEVKPVVSYFPDNKSIQTQTFPEKRYWIGGTAGMTVRF